MLLHNSEEAQPFLDTIFDHPEADGPRLVYADWLMENSQEQIDHHYAEFIKVQIEIAALFPLFCHPSEEGNEASRQTHILRNREAFLFSNFSRYGFWYLQPLPKGVISTGYFHIDRIKTDGTNPRTTVTYIQILRGFPYQMICPTIRPFVGIDCTRTDCFDEVGNGPDPYCPRCNGKGYINPSGPAILESLPTLEKIRFADKEPYNHRRKNPDFNFDFGWYDERQADGEGVHPASDLPHHIYKELSGKPLGDYRSNMNYETEELAQNDLSKVALKQARS